MAEHTPGPWELGAGPVNTDVVLGANGEWLAEIIRVDDDVSHEATAVLGANGEWLAEIIRVGDDVSHEATAANAYLIIAAPDLLSALRGLTGAALLIATRNEAPGFTDAFNAAQAAIAKAEGRR